MADPEATSAENVLQSLDHNPKNRFYVYEYWRPDTSTCFYVGKGKDYRAYVRKRHHNEQFNLILEELAVAGLLAELRLVRGGLSEDMAIELERDRISLWGSLGMSLANKTTGGFGTDGYHHSERTRRRISTSNMGRTISPEHREKLRVANLGKKHSDETRAKMRAAHAENPTPGLGARVPGLKRSEETKARMSVAHKGQKVSLETRQQISETLKAKNRHG